MSDFPRDPVPPAARVADRDAFIARVAQATAEASPELCEQLWVAVHSFPSLALLEASFAPDVVDDAILEIEAHLLREYPEVIATTTLRNDAVALASFGPPQRLSSRGDTARRRRFALERITVQGEPLFFSVRTGIAQSYAGEEAGELLRRARVAHLVACKPGHADTQVYDRALDQAVEAEARLLGRLVTAIEEDRLDVAFQPQVDLSSGRLVGAEALVRWPGRGSETLSPKRLIEAAEQAGSVVPLGGWMLRAACRQAARWRAEGLDPFRVAVNVSPVQLVGTDLFRSVEAALDAHDLPAEWLEIEITESGAIAGGEVAIETAHALRGRGVALALDDFGTGTSSLSRLGLLPVSRLKIDQSFVARCPPVREGRCLIRAIAAIGRSLGMRTLVEGVERSEQVDYVRAAGCDEAQGFYFAPGLTPDDLGAFARERGIGPA